MPKIGKGKRQKGFHRIFCLGSILDPRVKKLYFLKQSERGAIKRMLEREMHRAVEQDLLGIKGSLPLTLASAEGFASSNDESDNDNNEEDGDTTKKQPSIWAMVSGNDNSNHSENVSSIDSIIKEQLECYWKCPQINGDSEDPMLWWRNNKGKFPIVAVLARTFLGVPATSASSERIFSKAEQIISKKRSGLSPRKAGLLIWLAGFMKQQARVDLYLQEEDNDFMYDDDSD